MSLLTAFPGPAQRPSEKGFKFTTLSELQHRDYLRIQTDYWRTSSRTYHDFILSQGSSYVKPDLAVAFNSGCSQEETISWKKTIASLVEHAIPSVFTVSHNVR